MGAEKPQRQIIYICGVDAEPIDIDTTLDYSINCYDKDGRSPLYI